MFSILLTRLSYLEKQVGGDQPLGFRPLTAWPWQRWNLCPPLGELCTKLSSPRVLVAIPLFLLTTYSESCCTKTDTSACSLDWRGARRAWRINRAWADVFLGPLGLTDAGDDAVALEDVRTRGIGGSRKRPVAGQKWPWLRFSGLTGVSWVRRP